MGQHVSTTIKLGVPPRRWVLAAEAMAQTPHLSEASTNCGICVRTLKRWQMLPMFQVLYREIAGRLASLRAAEATVAAIGSLSRIAAIAIEARRAGDMKTALDAERLLSDINMKYAELEAVNHRMAALEEMFRAAQQVKLGPASTAMPLLQRLEAVDVPVPVE